MIVVTTSPSGNALIRSCRRERALREEFERLNIDDLLVGFRRTWKLVQ